MASLGKVAESDTFGMDEALDFTPFSIDVSPLQKFLLTLARQVRDVVFS